MQTEAEIIIKADLQALALAAAELFVVSALTSVGIHGRFTVALSGGTTPASLFRALRQEPYRGRVPWDKTHVFWVDERCVPSGDPLSNFGTARRELFEWIPIPPGNLHPMDGEGPPEEGAKAYQKVLQDFFLLKEKEIPWFDLLFLGIGCDGHTASIFPDHPALMETERLVVDVLGGDPYLQRLTLTLPVLNQGRCIAFLVAGSAKAEIIRDIFEQGGHRRLPAGMVRPRHGHGRLIWLLDHEAAGLLS